MGAPALQAHGEAAAADASTADPKPDSAARAPTTGGGRLPVVVLTTFFPNPRDPNRTPFLRNLVHALEPSCELSIVAPVPRRPQIGPWRDVAPVPAQEAHEGLLLEHPRYLAVPGLHWLSGLTYFIGVRRTLRELRARRGWFVLHAHCAYPDAVGAALAARSAGVPLVVTVHGSDVNVAAGQPLLRPQIRWALRAAARIVAVSRALQDRVASLTGVTPARLACIPCSGFSPAIFRPLAPDARAVLRERLGVGVEERLILFVGHLFPVKAVDVLLRAWALRDRQAAARLVLIGEGGERERLERLAREVGIESSVSFAGPLPQRAVAEWIGASDLLCLSSHSEGSPNVVVEALACGVPVVATRVGGVPDLVAEGASGLLVPPADPAAFARALDEALDRSWDRETIASTVAHLTWSALAARNHDALARVASETGHAVAV